MNRLEQFSFADKWGGTLLYKRCRSPVACHHGNAQTNKPTKCDGRIGPLISPLHNADKAPAGIAIDLNLMTTIYLQIYFSNVQNICGPKQVGDITTFSMHYMIIIHGFLCDATFSYGPANLIKCYNKTKVS